MYIYSAPPSEPGAAGLILFSAAASLTCSVCLCTCTSLWQSRFSEAWLQEWPMAGPEGGTIWVSDLSLRALGSFLSRMQPQQRRPLPPLPREGLMGTSVISSSDPINTNSSVYQHNLLCWLWPRLRVCAVLLPASAAWGWEEHSSLLKLRTLLRVLECQA